jgi:hypothetical protein
MAFYPTWQTTTATPTDPSQNWQNQFIQQIPPQNNGGAPTASAASTITPLNSLDFQPQVFEEDYYVKYLYY